MDLLLTFALVFPIVALGTFVTTRLWKKDDKILSVMTAIWTVTFVIGVMA